MAKRGRKPKPTALKKLEGNPGKRPLNELEPLPQVTMLRCPNWLEPEARTEWRRLAPVLIGAGILGVIRNGFVLLMVSNYWQMITIGLVIIAACAFDMFRRSKQ